MQLWEDTYTHSTVRTNDGTHSFFLVPVPVQVPVQVPRRPWSPRPWLPPSLNTDPHLFRPCLLFFRLAQWFLLFLPPYPPLSIPHTCPLLLDLNDHRPVRLFFFFIAPLPVTEPRFRDDRLLFIFSPLIVRTRPAFVPRPRRRRFRLAQRRTIWASSFGPARFVYQRILRPDLPHGCVWLWPARPSLA